VASTFATWVRAFDDNALMSSARPSRVTTTANWLRGFWSKNSSIKEGKMNLPPMLVSVQMARRQPNTLP
jgi:hypothetical protein